MSSEGIHQIVDDDGSDEENDACLKCCPRALCHPDYGLHRYFVLIFMCLLGFGSYFCYDVAGSLQKQIVEDMDISVGAYSQLYAWYSWPNTILCFFGGFLIDRVFGIRWGAIIFSGIIFLGQIVFALGGLFDLYWVMIAGRFIFGIGGESLAVAQNTYAVSWFKDRELNMVFGLQLSTARVGSTVNFLVMVSVYDFVANSYSGYTCLGVALMIASITCLLSFLAAFILAYFDKRAQRLLKKDEVNTGEVVNLTDAKDFCLSFWLLCLICVAFYVTISPFTALGSTFFQRKYSMSQQSANSASSIIYIVSAVLSPFLGFMIDYTGRNVFWVFLATLITMVAHGMLAFTFVHPLVAMIIMGLGYSVLACSLWPMVSLVIPSHQLGTAYGIMQSIQNLGLGCVVLAAGSLVDLKGYIVLEIFFLAWLSFTLILLTFVYVADQRAGGILNMSVKERRALKLGSTTDMSQPDRIVYNQETNPHDKKD